MRFILDPPLLGAVNMARDEALLRACTGADCPVALRFYAWSPATVSLGYFQDYTEFEIIPPPAGFLPVVRRTTGGGAILHDLELTYAMVIPLDHPLVKDRPNQLYELAHAAIINAVGGTTRLMGCAHLSGREGACGQSSPRRGPFFCFARRHALDVVVEVNHDGGIDGTAKLAGSAQRRSKTAILQHGSIILENRHRQQPSAAWSDLARSRIDFHQAAVRLLACFEQTLGMRALRQDWTNDELMIAERHEAQYAAMDWTRLRIRPVAP